MRRRPSTVLAAAAVLAALALVAPAGVARAGVARAGVAPVAAPAPGAPTGWLRLGHLAPGAPPMDVYLSAAGGRTDVIAREAGYGAVTPYSSLSPGTYRVTLRPAGAPPAADPALSADIEVRAGVACTTLVFQDGAGGPIRPTVLTDDLVAPAVGDGKVRVVQGAVGTPPVAVVAAGGVTLADGLGYGDASPYATVPEGDWEVAVTAGPQVSRVSLLVRSGSVNTVVVTALPGAGLTLTPLRDSASAPQAPPGGIAAGAGGTAPRPPSPVLPALLVGALAGGLTVLVLRRRRTRA